MAERPRQLGGSGELESSVWEAGGQRVWCVCGKLVGNVCGVCGVSWWAVCVVCVRSWWAVCGVCEKLVGSVWCVG